MTRIYKLVVFIFFTFLLIFPAHSQFIIKGKVKKRNTIIKVENSFSPTCYNVSVLENVDSLKRLVYSSRYIFTGKISRVQTRKRGIEKSKRSVFKVLVRRVLKGDISVLSDLFNFERRTRNSTDFAYVVEGSGRKGPCVSRGWAAILFAERLSSPVKLLIDPVPLTLDRVRRVKLAIKGKTLMYL
ncbi:unnamed protein product [Colias eurytheme]|nr:unnamed protein product [Colias eurytheme]